MTVVLWRIGVDTASDTADDLGGKGAAITGGRWNRPDHPVVYCASSIALAVLETVVHLGLQDLPLNRYLVRIDVPQALWDARKRDTHATLAVGWDALPAGKVSLDAGDAWLKSNDGLLYQVPSVIVPEEGNLLINPRHPDAARLVAVKLRRWQYDARLHAAGP